MTIYVCSDCKNCATSIGDVGRSLNNEDGEKACHFCFSHYPETLFVIVEHTRPASHIQKTKRPGFFNTKGKGIDTGLKL